MTPLPSDPALWLAVAAGRPPWLPLRGDLEASSSKGLDIAGKP